MSARLVLIAALAGACTSAPLHRDEVLAVPLTSATYVGDAHAIHLLTRARCVHEAQCGHATEGCFDAADLDERSSIGLDACPFGVDQARLDRCITALQHRRCGSQMRSLSEVPACVRAELCR